jgi:hypothetical protein
MKTKRRQEPSDFQVAELLCDWMIMPNDYRLDLTRAILVLRRGFDLPMIMSYMERRGYITDHVRLAWEIKPFVHRRLIRPIKGLRWKGDRQKQYVVAEPRVKNPAYLALFKKSRPAKLHCTMRARPMHVVTLVQY